MAYDPARAKSLFLNAADLADPAERAAYLDRECAGDSALRARVEALLAADGPARPDPASDATWGLDAHSPPGETCAASWGALPRTERGAEGAGPDDFSLTAGLPADRSQNFTFHGNASPGVPARTQPGGVIGGRYTLREVLGEGGMGTVYLAEQSRPVRRMVALKLVRLGLNSGTVLARFDAERQALALMDHPNIARVFDGGATDAGQPYFVMEHVRGTPITDYCDEHRLSVAARLSLFVAVCQAVQHAHQKGVIHRDLKPSNVLVAEVDGRPTPKVIDFGVAKATGASLTDQTLGDTGAIVGTPAYMSPEQADPSSMDIDTRTDVYALGVILYELLAGSPPIDPTQFRRGALLEMLRMVREVDPAKPSTRVSTADAEPSIAANRGIDPGQLKQALRGDLDWIVMKALEKDRSRRYETANGLAADIQRHLASEPVQAAPPSRSYRLRKFTRKHRVGVAAAGLVLLALVAGVAGTTWGLLKARHFAEAERRAKLVALANERKALRAAEGERLARLDAQSEKRMAETNERQFRAAAEQEKQAKETVEDVLGFVETKVFAAARPEGQEGGLGYDVKLADAIAAAAPSIERDFAGRPLTEARLRRTIGMSFHYLGKPDLAAAQFEAQRSILERILGPDHPETLRTMTNLATSDAALGRQAEALKLREHVLPSQKAKLGPDHPDTLATKIRLAEGDQKLGRMAEAIALPDGIAADPQDGVAGLKIAALRAWFGQAEEFAAVRTRALAFARKSSDVVVPGRAVKLSSILPSAEPAERDEALSLAGRAAPGGEVPYRPDRLLALGMAAYRAGDDPACDAALLAALREKSGSSYLRGTAAFFRAMRLHRRGRTDEARAIATEAAATMKPLPADQDQPMVGGASHDDLILWLAFQEAKSLIGFDAPVAK